MALELSSHSLMPLDYSNSGSNRENSGSPVNVSDSAPSSPPGSSAFTVVTPKGRDGKNIWAFGLFSNLNDARITLITSDNVVALLILRQMRHTK